MIVIFSLILVSILLVQNFLLFLRIRYDFQNHRKPLSEYLPIVTVLIAARNEEVHLPRLLASLGSLDYPEEKLQILIADDQSSDLTLKIIQDWCDRPSRSYFAVEARQTFTKNANGKANALAYLEKSAIGEFLFFTDADCEVNPGWIKEAVSCMDQNVGLLNGITQVKGNSWLAKMQEIDWWNTLGIVKIVTDLGWPTTGMGNNMVIRREALEKIGGFAHLPFCMTEDLELSRSIRKAGYRVIHQVSPEILVFTKAEPDWKALMHQRKRWMQGVITLPLFWLVMLFFQAAFFPAVVYLLWFSPLIGIGFWLLKMAFQSFFVREFSSKVTSPPNWNDLLMFDFYYLLSTSNTILYYFWPSRIQWKSRNYR
jgi:cellulose synthase/poly-beta-1,6-N-acetylglucosamine synthase-like glycosyltransferase